MNDWLSQSIDLITQIGSFLISEPIFYIVGLLILVIACRLFKGMVSA